MILQHTLGLWINDKYGTAHTYMIMTVTQMICKRSISCDVSIEGNYLFGFSNFLYILQY